MRSALYPVLRPVAVLGAQEDLLHPHGPVPLVAHRHLALAVGPEVGQLPLLRTSDRRRVRAWASVMGSGISSGVSEQA